MTRLMLERMREIHFLIYTQTYPTSPSLGEHFGVGEKTIDRDIEMMRDRLNLPIETDRAKGGYYYNGNVAMFPDVLLTEGE
ncbi:MAG: WYL domain-containing protein, partial [Limisphaerales bacterium]